MVMLAGVMVCTIMAAIILVLIGLRDEKSLWLAGLGSLMLFTFGSLSVLMIIGFFMYKLLSVVL
jgi:hypothetical protein